jgi:adenine deaminase
MKTKNGFKVSGNIVDVVNKRIFSGIISVEKGKIKSIIPSNRCDAQYITPGLIDSHVHIESSMLNPSEFARLAVVHGTVATVSDPHEIANVLGIEGVNYMIRNGNKVPFKFFFGAPSCVPATSFETSGATITSSDVSDLLKRDDVYYFADAPVAIITVSAKISFPSSALALKGRFERSISTISPQRMSVLKRSACCFISSIICGP